MTLLAVGWFFLSMGGWHEITTHHFETSVACQTARAWASQRNKNVSECYRDDPRSPWREEKALKEGRK